MYKPTRGIIEAAPLTVDDARAQIESRRFDHIGGHWSRAFRPTADVQVWVREVFADCMSDNGIFSLFAPEMGDIEGDIIGWALDLMTGPADATGNITNGGSESIYCAMHAARNWARANRPGVKTPTIVVPRTAHPAYWKACEYLGMEIKRVPVTAEDRADPVAMEAAIDENTIALVGSAPSWPLGMFDPIEDLAAVAVKHDLWMHVDGCIGGYILPFLEMLGEDIPRWDFRVDGVRSISADLHKFGYTPKPCSTILWRDEELLQYHLFEVTESASGPYLTTAMAGSRSEAPVFTQWALIRTLGREGYLEQAKAVMRAKQELMTGIEAIDGLSVPYTDLFPLSVEAVHENLLLIYQGMAAKGWVLLGVPDPPILTLPLDPALAGEVAERFLADLAEATAAAPTEGEGVGGALRYG
ncbi:MAG: aspartate aminotransferase family protein [Actinobacteria bacterium]|nr:aspartate aminotransferase family protein [Actinomycetota bacterium]